MTMKRTILILSATALIAVLAGCGASSSVTDATAQFCTTVTAYQQSVQAISTLDTNATVGQLKDTQKKVDQAAQAVVTSAATVKEAKIDDFQTAQQNLQKTVNGVPDSATVKEAMVTVAPAAKAVNDAAAEVRTSAQCK
jgi:predicted negative regulator of RcsB-dependent stress response